MQLKMNEKLLVYIDGPLTVGDVDENVRVAMQMGTRLLKLGFNPVIPHLNVFLERYWEETDQLEEMGFGPKEWLDYDFALLEKCDVLLRMEGESPGSDRETAFAMGRRIPVFYSLQELKEYRLKLEKECK